MATTKVNVICGPLGVGKSSAILKLVAKKRSDAKWAILVNEIGTLFFLLFASRPFVHVE